MEDIDWDDEANIERWCADQRENAVRYLRDQPVKFGALGEWPAWHVAPYVSVWAVESVRAPGRVGWWVISGDLPTDYTSGDGAPDPRSAVAAFAKLWESAAARMERGEQPEGFTVGSPSPENAFELAPLLRSRAMLLQEWVGDDSCWDT
jgi:hypothetical protein